MQLVIEKRQLRGLLSNIFQLELTAAKWVSSVNYIKSWFKQIFLGENAAKNGSGGREGLDWRWSSGGLKEDQEQRRPRRWTERINEAQQALAKTRSDAAAVAEVETVAAERVPRRWRVRLEEAAKAATEAASSVKMLEVAAKVVVGETGRDEGAIVNVRATANGKPPLDGVRPSRTTNRHSSTR
ncbi:Hypothetical predicted protein [Cloeon dipterum]|nr:Hypothetical predicted protein [Cloeon dipterum]